MIIWWYKDRLVSWRVILQAFGLKHLVRWLHTLAPASIKVLDWWKEIHDASVAGSHVHMHFAGNEERSWYFTPQKVETKIHKITVTCSNLTHQTLNMCECFVFSMIFHDVFFMDFSIFFKPPGYLLHIFLFADLGTSSDFTKKRSLEISIVASQQMLWVANGFHFWKMTKCQQKTCATMKSACIQVIKRLIHIMSRMINSFSTMSSNS